MALGFVLKDPTGSFVILDTTMHSGFIPGSVDVNSGNQSGSLTDPLLANGSPFYFTVSALITAPPIVSFSGTTMTWTDADTTATWIGVIYYGVR